MPARLWNQPGWSEILTIGVDGGWFSVLKHDLAKLMEKELKENEALWSLFEAISQLQGAQDCARFFRDLCTFPELRALAERWEVAQLVAQGVPYRQISKQTGASTATVTRVAHWVRHGEGGYRLLLRQDKGRGTETGGRKPETGKKD